MFVNLKGLQEKYLATARVTSIMNNHLTTVDYKRDFERNYHSYERPLHQQCHRLDGVRHSERPRAEERVEVGLLKMASFLKRKEMLSSKS